MVDNGDDAWMHDDLGGDENDGLDDGAAIDDDVHRERREQEREEEEDPAWLITEDPHAPADDDLDGRRNGMGRNDMFVLSAGSAISFPRDTPSPALSPISHKSGTAFSLYHVFLMRQIFSICNRKPRGGVMMGKIFTCLAVRAHSPIPRPPSIRRLVANARKRIQRLKKHNNKVSPFTHFTCIKRNQKPPSNSHSLFAILRSKRRVGPEHYLPFTTVLAIVHVLDQLTTVASSPAP